MLKFLLILALIVYAVYKVSTLFYRAGVSSRQRKNGDININNPQKNKNKGNFKGGDYVDYEEVK